MTSPPALLWMAHHVNHYYSNWSWRRPRLLIHVGYYIRTEVMTIKHTRDAPTLPPSPNKKKSTNLHDSEKSPLKAQGGSGPLDPPGQLRAWLRHNYRSGILVCLFALTFYLRNTTSKTKTKTLIVHIYC